MAFDKHPGAVGVIGDFTARLLAESGIAHGMRVLDAGCGRGDVSLLVRDLVGATGEVLGIDRSESDLSVGRQRAARLQLDNVTFAHADLAELPADFGLFDAVVCRRVLTYQPDLGAALACLAESLVPAGLLIAQEHDATSMPICIPPMALHQQVNAWIRDTMLHEGADVHIGLRLPAALRSSGFVVERVQAQANVMTGAQAHAVAAIVRAMQGRIVEAGVATEQEIEVDTLDARLAAERERTGGTCIWEIVFGVSARKAC